MQENILIEFENYLIENYDSSGESNTIKAYLSDIKQFIKYFDEHFGEQIVDFSRADFIEYKKHMMEDLCYKFSTINRKTASLSIYEDFLIEKEIKSKKVIKKVDFYKIDRPYITSDMLPRETIEKVRLKSGRENKRDYAILALLDEGGMRVSELIKLQLERDINLENFTILLLGKGNKIRHININQVMLDAIIDYLPIREEILKGRENKYLFVSNKTANTNTPMSRTTVNDILEKYCIEVNKNKINPHILRHNAATKMYEEGYSDARLKKVLGQTSNATDIYTHPGGEEKARINRR